MERQMHQQAALEHSSVPEIWTGSPPRWLNLMTAGILRTPLLERWVGQTLGLISIKGRKSGKVYTTPVTYLLEGDDVIILSKRFRLWWRNLVDNPETVLRLAGRNRQGVATILPPGEEALTTMTHFLEIAASRRSRLRIRLRQ